MARITISIPDSLLKKLRTEQARRIKSENKTISMSSLITSILEEKRRKSNNE